VSVSCPSVQNTWPRWALAGILVVYLALGVVYSVTTPVFEAPDESFHFFVVKHIVEHRALPVQWPETRGLWAQEGSQPPLYYLVAALLVGGIDLQGAEELLWMNPQANIGDPANPGNKNRYIHPHTQDFPWQGAVLAVHVLRFFSLLLGALTVVLAWGIATRIFAPHPVIPLSSAAIIAYIPQYLFITSSVNNDNAMAFLAAWCLYMLLGRLRETAEDGAARVTLRWAGLGAVLGMALLAKLSAIALVPLIGAVIALRAWQFGSWKAAVRMSLAVALPALAVAGWWYVRNVMLYGEPTGLTAMWEVVGRRSDFGQDLWGEFRGLRYSFWGLFGWFSVPMPAWVYHLFDAASVLAVGGALWAGLCRLRTVRSLGLGLSISGEDLGEPSFQALAMGLLLAWMAMVLIALVRWTLFTQGSQGRLLYAAMVPLALFFLLGLRAWFRTHVWRDWAGTFVAACILALGVAAPPLWIAPAYARPQVVTKLPQGAVPMDLAYGDAIVLRGVRFLRDEVHPGDTLPIDLYWEATQPMSDADELVVWLRMIKERPLPTEKAGGVVALEDAYPGSGTFPVVLWPVGQILEDRQYLWVGSDTPAPMIARLDVDLYRADNLGRLAAPTGDLPTIGRVKIVPKEWPRVDPDKRIAHFECGVSLAGYEMESETRPGSTLQVKLIWSVESPPRRDYVVFVHLMGQDGQIWGYGDGAPRDGNYSTWWWAAGEVIEDNHGLIVMDRAVPGRYHVMVGLYDTAGRVGAYAMDGTRLPDDAVDLGMVEVR
jgi:4-amino-4-deoxy-L-arabinose transferase-like glycosyltransferase